MKRVTMILLVFSMFSGTLSRSAGWYLNAEQSEQVPASIANALLSSLKNIESWSIGFQKEQETIVVRTLSDGSLEVVEKKYGQSDSNIEILDKIKFLLENKYGMILKDESEAKGKIKIDPALYHSIHRVGYSESIVRIFFYDKNDNLLYKKNVVSAVKERDLSQVPPKCAEFINEIVN